MNIEAWILNKITRGEEATVSLALLEKLMDGPFLGARIQDWAKGFALNNGCKCTFHWPSDVVTFYPITT
jgi:hypothetical protein